MTTSEIVLERLSSTRSSSRTARKVLEILKKQEAKPVSSEPSTVTVSEALRLWRTRMKNVVHTRAAIQGVEDLVNRLEELAPQRRVDQFGFLGPQASITVFFTRNDGIYLGSAILDKRAANQAA